MAKKFLQKRNLAFETINVENDHKMFEELKRKTKMRTVPQIFIGEHFVGGYDQLSQLTQKELDQLLFS